MGERAESATAPVGDETATGSSLFERDEPLDDACRITANALARGSALRDTHRPPAASMADRSKGF